MYVALEDQQCGSSGFVNTHYISVTFDFLILYVTYAHFLVLSPLRFQGINCFVWHEMIHQCVARALNTKYRSLGVTMCF